MKVLARIPAHLGYLWHYPSHSLPPTPEGDDAVFDVLAGGATDTAKLWPPSAARSCDTGAPRVAPAAAMASVAAIMALSWAAVHVGLIEGKIETI